MSSNLETVTATLQKALDMATEHPKVTDCAIGTSIGQGFSAMSRKCEAETIEYSHGHSLRIKIYSGKRSGVASGSDVSEQGLRNMINAAVDIATYTQPDPAAGLADADQIVTDPIQFHSYYPWELTPEQAMERAIECEQLAFAQDKRITNSDGCQINNYAYYAGYANSRGFFASKESTGHGINLSLVAEQDEQMEQASDYGAAINAEDLCSIETLADKVVQKTLSRLNPKKPPTGQYPILFAPNTARSLIRHFSSAILGGAIYKKASFLLGKVGEQIFPDWMTITEHPILPKGFGNSGFDADGLATYKKAFVKNGVLQHYALSTYSARRLNLTSTANAGGYTNLQLTPGEKDFSAMLNELSTGLYVTSVMGPGVKLITGHYSRGIYGFWVENGEIQFPVNQATIAGNLADMFMNIRLLGNDVDQRSSVLVPSMIVDGMMIA